jgi:hypothetical protein
VSGGAAAEANEWEVLRESVSEKKPFILYMKGAK